jgi:DNA-binding NarL/FixJ family response regulator
VKRLTILLGDDHPLILQGIKGLLESHYEIVGREANGRALAEAALRLRPDMVVLDVSMPILNGIDAAREIKKALPDTKFVFLSMHSNAIYLRRALEAGALGYVLKSGAAEELVTAIEDARKGNVYITPSFGHEVLANARDWREKKAKSAEPLTERQKQILQLLAEGKQNKEIAAIANISVRTVEFHRDRLMTKFGARNLAELTMFGIQAGFVFGRE